jgi:4-amino-4-deoxy-L-arabinose transferase-like glycosyltransferase
MRAGNDLSAGRSAGRASEPRRLDIAAQPASPSSTGTRAARPSTLLVRAGALLPIACAASIAWLLRIAWPAPSDVFGDEVIYVDLSTSVSNGHYPAHFANEGVFLLHPPLFFLIGAVWERLAGPFADYFQLVDSMRLLEALFAVATAALVAAITTRIAGRRWGTAAGALFAVEPYALRTNGRVLLETPALAFVLAGYLVLLGHSALRAATGGGVATSSTAHPARRAAAAGLLMGLGIVTVEIAAVIIVGPLLAAMWRRWLLPRRLSLLALGAALAPYGAYLVSLAATHHLEAFFLIGLRRVLGLINVTGFNAPGAPSLMQTLLDQASMFGTTYVLVGLGLLAGLYLLCFGLEDGKVVGSMVLFSAVAIGFEAAFGTIEEQFLYVLLVPALVAVACAAHRVWRRRRRTTHASRGLTGWLVPIALVFVLIPLYDFGVWAHDRSQPNDGLAEVSSYLKRNAGSDVVGTNVSVATNVLRHEHIDAVTLSSPQTAARQHVEYLVVLTAELVPGYGQFDAAQTRFFEKHGRLVFSMAEPTYDDVLLYRTTDPAAW